MSVYTVSAGRYLLSVKFLLSVLILVLAAVGLWPGVQALSKHYMKESIAIRRPLKEFDISRLPSFQNGWELTWHDVPVEEVGTEQSVHVTFTKKESGKEPQSAELFVTYYSNPRDKIPHTPDVCGRQEGGIIKKLTTITLDTPELAPEHPKIKASLVIFQWPKVNLIIIYCFCAEGEFPHTRNHARWVIAKPGNYRTYFSKIEARATIGHNQAEALETGKTLLREALSVLWTEHFPHKEQLKRR